MKIKWLALPLIAVIVAVASLYAFAHTLPNLVLPLRSVNAFAFSDGGSVTIEIEDAAGNQFYFGIEGSLDTPREVFPSFYARPIFGIPLIIKPKVGSLEERELADFAKNLATSNLTTKALSKVTASELDGLSKEEFKYAVIYSIYTTLSERHASN